MSGDDELDKLLFSLSNSSKKKKNKQGDAKETPSAGESQQPSDESDETDQVPGFDPLDVVELTDEQRKVVTWLSRHRRSNFAAIQEALEIDPTELHTILDTLLEQKRIQSTVRNEQTLYSAPIHGRAGRRLRGFPEDIWKKAGLDDD